MQHKYTSTYKYFLIILIGFEVSLGLITTDDCESAYGCFRFPNDCTNETCLILFKWQDGVDSINFTLSARMSNIALLDSSWLGIGFSTDDKMGDENAILCKHTLGSSSVEQYYTQSHVTPTHLSDKEPSAGISDMSIDTDDGFLICSFSRIKKKDDLPKFFDLNSPYFILAAAGPLFRSCLMVISWVFLVPIAIVVARYYKKLFPDILVFGFQFWFSVHFPTMILAFGLSFIAFLVVLSDLKWTWVKVTSQLEFAHSFFGILTICLAFLQISIAIFRCDKNHKYRFVFNYVHQSLGLTTYGCALIAMFLGVSIDEMNLGSVGYGLLIGWVLWFLMLVASIEVFDYMNNKNKKTITNVEVSTNDRNPESFRIEENTDNSENNIKKFLRLLLLTFHVIAAFAFMLALVVNIAD